MSGCTGTNVPGSGTEKGNTEMEKRKNMTLVGAEYHTVNGMMYGADLHLTIRNDRIVYARYFDPAPEDEASEEREDYKTKEDTAISREAVSYTHLNILPYAYVMGLTDKWIKQFENIAVPPADWYDAEDDLLGRLYWLEMMERIEELRTYTSYSSSATSSSTGSSGDSGGTSYSSDGGGYSGGGYGGGGGGAW